MELLERETCLSDLADWLDAAVSDGGNVALVYGEAGIGKTSLLQAFSKQQVKVTRVLWGACDALFTPRPLAPLYDIAQQTRGKLLAAVEAEANRDAIFTAALDEIERGEPSLVVFEDMHWADEATLDLLKFLGRRIQRTRSMLVLTYRDDEVGARHPLRFVIGDLPRSNIRRLSLEPLSAAAVAKLAKDAGVPAAELHSTTGGNPFFLTEVLAEPNGNVPTNVRDAALARAARLSPAAREVAELVSVVPGKAESWLIEQAVPSYETGIEGCLSIGMIRDAEGSLAFRHELARRALEDSLSQLRQQSLHAKVLAILQQRTDVSPARLAHHADNARNAEAVLRFAPLAAAQASSVGAHREAASHFRAALRHADALAPEERARLLEQLSYECYLTDQVEHALEARRAALEIWRASASRLREGDALRWLSRLSWFAGRRKDADRFGVEAVRALESLPPGPELAMAYSNRAQLDMLAGNVDSAIDWAQRTLKLAEPAGYHEILGHALNNLGTARLNAGDEAGWADLIRSLSLALEAGYQEHAARAYTNLSSTAVTNRRYNDATRYLSDGIAYCEKHDLDSWRRYMLAWRARARFEQGNWNGASEDIEVVLQHPCTAPISRIPALIVLGQMRIRRGDPNAEAMLKEARQLAEQTQELQRIGPLACAFADAAWINDDREEIDIHVQEAYELALERRDPWMKGELELWLSRAGAYELLPPPEDIAEPFALEIAGDWRAAADAWRALGCPYEQANALASSGREQEQLEALSILEQLGATAAANALRKRMRAQGVRRVPRGARVSTKTHSYGLTKREAEILELLSEGLRNANIAKRLFLATKTVDHHVSAILTKLGVSSRIDAVALMRKNQDADNA